MNLFNVGDFQLHSGLSSNFKIDCDTLASKDIDALAELISNVIEFSEVIGVPKGGVRLAEALKKYTMNTGSILIVDDVLTTGRSMEEAFAKVKLLHQGKNVIGIVIFARGKCPFWVKSIFQFNTVFEIRG